MNFYDNKYRQFNFNATYCLCYYNISCEGVDDEYDKHMQ